MFVGNIKRLFLIPAMILLIGCNPSGNTTPMQSGSHRHYAWLD